MGRHVSDDRKVSYLLGGGKLAKLAEIAADRVLARVINPIVQDARRSLNSIWADTLDAAGYPREKAQQFIELTHYMMRGLFLVGYWLPYQIDRRRSWNSVAPHRGAGAPHEPLIG